MFSEQETRCSPRGGGGTATVFPVLLAARELRRYQRGGFSGVSGELGLLKTSLGGAEAGRGGRWGEAESFSLNDDLRFKEGGESRAEFIIGVAGGVVVGVAGWRTIARLGETCKGVSWSLLGRLVEEPARSSADMVGERRQECVRVAVSLLMTESENVTEHNGKSVTAILRPYPRRDACFRTFSCRSRSRTLRAERLKNISCACLHRTRSRREFHG